MRDGLGLRTRLLTTRRTILRQHSITHLWTERKCVVHWYAHTTTNGYCSYTVLHCVVVMMGQHDPIWWWSRGQSPLQQQEVHHSTVCYICIGAPSLCCWGGHLSSCAGCTGEMCVNTVVVAAHFITRLYTHLSVSASFLSRLRVEGVTHCVMD